MNCHSVMDAVSAGIITKLIRQGLLWGHLLQTC